MEKWGKILALPPRSLCPNSLLSPLKPIPLCRLSSRNLMNDHPPFQMEQLLQVLSNAMLRISHTNQAMLSFLSTNNDRFQDRPDSKVCPSFSSLPSKDVLAWLDHFEMISIITNGLTGAKVWKFTPCSKMSPPLGTYKWQRTRWSSGISLCKTSPIKIQPRRHCNSSRCCNNKRTNQ